MDQLYIVRLEDLCPEAVPAGCMDCFYIVRHEAREEVVRSHAALWADMSCRRFVFCGEQAQAWSQAFDAYDVEQHLQDEVCAVTDTAVADDLPELARRILRAMENAAGTVHQVLAVCDDASALPGLERISHVYNDASFPPPHERRRAAMHAELEELEEQLQEAFDNEPDDFDHDAYAEWEDYVDYLSETISDIRLELDEEE